MMRTTAISTRAFFTADLSAQLPTNWDELVTFCNSLDKPISTENYARLTQHIASTAPAIVSVTDAVKTLQHSVTSNRQEITQALFLKLYNHLIEIIKSELCAKLRLSTTHDQPIAQSEIDYTDGSNHMMAKVMWNYIMMMEHAQSGKLKLNVSMGFPPTIKIEGIIDTAQPLNGVPVINLFNYLYNSAFSSRFMHSHSSKQDNNIPAYFETFTEIQSVIAQFGRQLSNHIASGNPVLIGNVAPLLFKILKSKDLIETDDISTLLANYSRTFIWEHLQAPFEEMIADLEKNQATITEVSKKIKTGNILEFDLSIHNLRDNYYALKDTLRRFKSKFSAAKERFSSYTDLNEHTLTRFNTNEKDELTKEKIHISFDIMNKRISDCELTLIGLNTQIERFESALTKKKDEKRAELAAQEKAEPIIAEKEKAAATTIPLPEIDHANQSAEPIIAPSAIEIEINIEQPDSLDELLAAVAELDNATSLPDLTSSMENENPEKITVNIDDFDSFAAERAVQYSERNKNGEKINAVKAQSRQTTVSDLANAYKKIASETESLLVKTNTLLHLANTYETRDQINSTAHIDALVKCQFAIRHFGKKIKELDSQRNELAIDSNSSMDADTKNAKRRLSLALKNCESFNKKLIDLPKRIQEENEARANRINAHKIKAENNQAALAATSVIEPQPEATFWQKHGSKVVAGVTFSLVIICIAVAAFSFWPVLTGLAAAPLFKLAADAVCAAVITAGGAGIISDRIINGTPEATQDKTVPTSPTGVNMRDIGAKIGVKSFNASVVEEEVQLMDAPAIKSGSRVPAAPTPGYNL